jgi:copper chaperone NosL
MKRRDLLSAAALLALAGRAAAGESAVPAGQADAAPLENELEKYPRCTICNMDRRKFHYARHLLHYGDGTAHGTCSVHCAAESMLRERRRGFRAIYAADYGTASEPRPLTEAGAATYLIGSDLPGVMTRVSKVAFADAAAAREAQAAHGGEIATFAPAVAASLGEMAASVSKRYDNDRERLRRAGGEG